MYFAHVVLVAVLLQVAVTVPVSYYQQLSEEDAARLEAWTPADGQIWQLSGQTEGDMVLAPNQRNGAVDTRLRWPNREIPYKFAPEITQDDQRTISQALQIQFGQTCIKIRPYRESDKDFVYITGDQPGCWSSVGRTGGLQKLNLQRPGCVDPGVIAHEFLHAAGFYHQQSASDRDDYVTIVWRNIEKGMEYNFEKLGHDTVHSFGEKYDYGSLMHYDNTAFSVNGQPTIVPHDPNAVIGQQKGLSSSDIRKLNRMYGCSA